MPRQDESSTVNLNLLRDTLLTFVARAGKGKDEVLQVLARETAATIAALLKQPLADFGKDLAHNHRIQLTIELVPKKKVTTSRSGARKKVKTSDGAGGNEKQSTRKQPRSRSK